MNSLLITSFETELKARDAMKKLDDLALNGEIDLYERAMIRRTIRGRSEVFKEGGSAGWQTIGGALLGGLIGLALSRARERSDLSNCSAYLSILEAVSETASRYLFDSANASRAMAA